MPRTDYTPQARPETPVKARRTNSQRLTELALRAADVREQRRRAKERLAELEKDELTIWTQMIELGVGFGDTIVGSRVRLERSWRSGGSTVAMAKARDAGALTPLMLKALEPYMTLGDPFEEWNATLIKAEVPA